MENPQRESETKEGLHKAIDRAHGEREPSNPWDRRKDVGVKYANVQQSYSLQCTSKMCFSFSRIITDHEVHMKEMLKGGLEWFCSEKKGKGNFAAKLEGRYT